MLETAGSLVRKALAKGIKKKKPPKRYPLYPNEDGSWSIGRAPHINGKSLSTIVDEWVEAGFIPKGTAYITVELDAATNSLYIVPATKEDLREARAKSPRRDA